MENGTADLHSRFNRSPRQREGISLTNNNAERLLRDEPSHGEAYEETELRTNNASIGGRIRISDLRRRGTYRQEENMHRLTMTLRRHLRREMIETHRASGLSYKSVVRIFFKYIYP